MSKQESLYHQKLNTINQERRKQRNAVYFQCVRYQIIKGGERGKGRVLDNQHEIVIMLKNYNLNGQGSIDFTSVNHFLCEFDGQLQQQVAIELAKAVFGYFIKNGHALACVAHAMNMCQQNQSLMGMLNVQQLIKQLLSANYNDNTQKLQNERPLLWLLCSLLKCTQNVGCFSLVNTYYNVLMKQLGCYDSCLLFYLAGASKYRDLLPEAQVIQIILGYYINYQVMREVDVEKMWELLQNYVRFDQSRQFHSAVITWIDRQLKDRRFPSSRKNELIQLITSIIKSHSPQTAQASHLVKLGVFKQIMTKARFSDPSTKGVALQCLTEMVKICPSEQIRYYVENYSFLEIFLFAFELQLNGELVFKLFSALGIIMSVNQQYYERACDMGFKKIADRYILTQDAKVVAAVFAIIEYHEINK